MKKYLIGCSRDNFKDGLYPLILVDEITKEDLIRSKDKNNEIIIINVYDGSFYNPDKNTWENLKQFEKFTDQWKDDVV